LLSGQLADHWGRRYPLIFGLLINFSFALGSSFSNNFETLVILRSIFGISVGIISPISATYIIEICPMEIRGKMLIFTAIFWTFGELAVCLIAYIFLDSFSSGNWRALLLWAAFPAFITFFLSLFFLEESPRYLLIFKKYDQAFFLLEKAIKQNNKIERHTLNEEEKESLKTWAEIQVHFLKNGATGNPVELFREERHKITPLLWIIWFVLSCVYYGNIFILPTVLRNMKMEDEANINEFLQVFVSVACELPSSIIALFIIEIHDLGRKNSLIITFALSSISYFISFGLKRMPFLVMATAARFFLNMSFLIIYPFTTEIYPTAIRTTGLGISSAFSRIGGISMPWISIASLKIGKTGPFLIYGILTSIATISSALIPYDTTGKELDRHKGYQDVEETISLKE